VTEFTEDRFLDGKVTLRQPETGFRSGLDAVMLAAAVPAHDGGHVLELGAGAGAASLCLAARLSNCSIAGVEIDPGLVELAQTNARANGVDSRVRFVQGDTFSLPTELRRDFAHVFSNLPFHDGEGESSPDAARERALRDTGRLADWLSAGVKRVASGGSFTVILRADRLGEALAAFPDRGICIFPLWPRAGQPAKRILVQLRKGSGAPLTVLPGLVLHEADGRYSAEAEAILRSGAALALARPRLYGPGPPRTEPES
jgi:tRNA1Val (adenine37-N6)-methyltransferase